MKNYKKIAGLTGLVLLLGLGLISCVSTTQYRKQIESLKQENINVRSQNDSLLKDIAILNRHNEMLAQQLKDAKQLPYERSSAGVDITPLISRLQQKGLELTIRDGQPAVLVFDIFDPGEVTLSKEGKNAVKKVASAITSELPSCSLRIDGYTDNQPIKKHKNYKNNKELSAARAKNVANFLVKECGFVQSRVQSEGLGEVNPIADNKTKEGRDKNRRVELVILVK